MSQNKEEEAPPCSIHVLPCDLLARCLALATQDDLAALCRLLAVGNTFKEAAELVRTLCTAHKLVNQCRLARTAQRRAYIYLVCAAVQALARVEEADLSPGRLPAVDSKREGCAWIVARTLPRALARCPALRAASFSGSHWAVTDELLAGLGKCCGALRELRLNYCELSTAGLEVTWVWRARTAQVIHVGTDGKMAQEHGTSEALAQARPTANAVSSLSIPCTHPQALASGQTSRLEALSLVRCSTAVGTGRVLLRFRCLRELDVSWCSLLDPKLVRACWGMLGGAAVQRWVPCACQFPVLLQLNSNSWSNSWLPLHPSFLCHNNHGAVLD